MEQIDGVVIEGRLYRYPGVTYRTNCGIMLSFQNDSHKWNGIYPGMSWDDFYNNHAKMNIELLTPSVAHHKTRYPLFVWPFKPVGTCQRFKCDENTDSKYCSMDCWYYETLDIIKQAIQNANSVEAADANVRLMERVVSQYGPLVQLSTYTNSAS